MKEQKKRNEKRNRHKMKWNETDESKQYDEIERSAKQQREEKGEEKKSVSGNIKKNICSLKWDGCDGAENKGGWIDTKPKPTTQKLR